MRLGNTLGLIAMAAMAIATPRIALAAALSDAQVKAKLAEIDAEMAKMSQLRADLVKLLSPEPPAAPAGPKPSPAPSKSWTDKIRLDGYVQTRFTADEGADSAFSARRARLNIRGNPTARSKFRIEFTADKSTTGIEAAWVDYRFSDAWSVCGGQVALPFGYELLQGSSDLLPFERTLAMTKPFADRYDDGLILTRKADGLRPELNLWVVNGQGRKATDADNRKNVGARLNWATRWGYAGISYQNGSYVDPATSVRTKRDALGLHAVYTGNPWTLQGECVTGKALGNEILGWYTQAAWQLPHSSDRLFGRYERYDPNTSLTGDSFRGTLIGYARELDPSNRVTLQFQDAMDAGVSADQWGLQWQLKY